MDDKRPTYYAINLTQDCEFEDWLNKLIDLSRHLKANGYDFYLTCESYNVHKDVLLINTEQTGYIDTILMDRGFEYKYKEV